MTDEQHDSLDRIVSRVYAGAPMPFVLNAAQRQYVSERMEMIRGGARLAHAVSGAAYMLTLQEAAAEWQEQIAEVVAPALNQFYMTMAEWSRSYLDDFTDSMRMLASHLKESQP